MIRYASSWRALRVEDALDRAARVANQLGVSRVTNITRLDRIGLPVFASVRPDAAQGSLCVNAGKGFSVAEARIGAYMEAIEFCMAEPAHGCLTVELKAVDTLLGGSAHPNAVLDLCPVFGRAVFPNTLIPCVFARSIDDEKFLVPAELVFFPFPLPASQRIFGSTTNGLASGATLLEAMIHALLEVVERDSASFEWLGRRSSLISVESLPKKHSGLVAMLEAQGFQIAIRLLPNDFDIPCFHATLWEPENLDPVYVTDGYGCHLDPEIALTRAMTEACQSRLTFIHGARDDIWDRHTTLAGLTLSQRREYARKLTRREMRDKLVTDFGTVPNRAADCNALEDLFATVCDSLRDGGVEQILWVALTPADYPVQVARVIVPTLEYFTPTVHRVGPRLAKFANRA